VIVAFLSLSASAELETQKKIVFLPQVRSALIYATGGLGVASVSNSYFADLASPLTFIVGQKISHTRAGWTIGAGIDYAFDDHWSVGAQYRYSNFGGFSDNPLVFSSPAGGWMLVDRHLTENQVQLEISYKFN
jgi:outer membrane immunogenic protein